MGSRLTIFQQGLLLAVLPLAFQLGFVWLVADQERQHAKAEDWALHSKAVLTQAQVVLRSLLETESSLRGALLLADADSRQRQEQTRAEALAAVEQLAELVSDNPGQEAHAREIAERTAALLDRQAQVARALRQDGPQPATAQLRTGAVRRPLDELRRDLDAFVREEERLDAARRRE